MLFAGIDIADMEAAVMKYVIEVEFDGEKDRWEKEMWGFEAELGEKMFNEELFRDVKETGIETKISPNNEQFDELLAFTIKQADVFFDSLGNEIARSEYEKKAKGSSCTISCCEVSATS